MLCDQCGASIDYRFPTTCLSCSHELRAKISAEKPKPIQHEHRQRLTFKHHAVNLAVTLGATLLGLPIGAIGTVIAAVLILRIFPHPEIGCGTGSALTLLLLAIGGHIGSVITAILAFENRIYKVSHCCSATPENGAKC